MFKTKLFHYHRKRTPILYGAPIALLLFSGLLAGCGEKPLLSDPPKAPSEQSDHS